MGVRSVGETAGIARGVYRGASAAQPRGRPCLQRWVRISPRVKRRRRDPPRSPWPRRFMLGLAAFAAGFALDVPPGTAGNCVDDGYYCFVESRGEDVGWNIRHAIIDDYWRDAIREAESSSIGAEIDEYYRDSALRAASAGATLDSSAAEAAAVLSANRFRWGDFGVGIGAGVGSMVALTVLSAGVFGVRLSRRRRPAGLEHMRDQ